jgi:ATP-dependent helicase/DNAse subunit B
LSNISDNYIDYLKSNFNIREVRLDDNTQFDFSYIGYGSVEEEIEAIARHIKSLSVAGRITGNSWVIVTFPRISDYRAITERVFRKYGLTYTISLQKPAISRRTLRDAIYLLDCIVDDFPRQKFAAVLSSPTFKKIPDVVKHSIISLSMKTGIVKGIDSWNLGSFMNMRKSAKHVTIRNEIEKALAQLGFEAEQDALDELHNAFNTVSLVAGMTENDTLSLRRYTDYLKHILSRAEYRHEDVGIQIMDFPETRGLAPDYLYFCGLKDGDMPSRPPIDHILPDSIRTEYGLINLKTHLLIQKLNFQRLIGSSSHTHLSYPSLDGDKLFLPSSYLAWDKEISENIYGVYSREELQIKKQVAPLSDTIRQIRIDQKSREKLLKRTLRMPMRVTDIDSFRKCPRRFFIERVLYLEASEIAQYEIEAKLLGTIIHDIMEKLIKEPLDETKAVRSAASRITDTILRDVPVDDYLKALLKESFLEILPDIVDIELQMRKEGFFPYELEKRFEETVLPGISLKGRIDRIDRKEDTFRIIDYKTGTVQIGSDIISRGKNLQIALYAAMLKAHGMIVEKTGVYSLKDIAVKWIPTSRDRHILEDYVASSLRYLEETVHEMHKGIFRAHPLDEFYCTTCPEAPFCPYIHGKDTSSHESVS